MKCSKCGAEFRGEFCPECGTPARAEAQNQQPVNVPAAPVPAYPQPYPLTPVDPGKGLNIASLVLGICGLVIPYCGLVCAIVGLVLGLKGKARSSAVGAPTGMATAGIVMSIIGIAASVLIVILIGGFLAVAASAL